MTQATTSASLIRVSVTAGTRRADLGVPGGIPVAELLPELARELGQLDAATASRGFRLVRHDGIAVEPDRSLAAQGVELRAMESLLPLKDVWSTSLHASGIRLRNARDWLAEGQPLRAPGR